MGKSAQAMSVTAAEWAEWDPNELTKRLAFGTAGLRGPMGPGTNAMNDLLVIQTTQGLVRYVIQQNGAAPSPAVGDKRSAESPKWQIVIGYDHRAHPDWGLSSERFARLTAAVVAAAGLEPVLLAGFVPTPLVAFATTVGERAVAGVMVTASHNPAADNGYKVYWREGVQFTEPHDSAIAAEILEQLKPWQQYDADAVPLATEFTATISDQYYQAMKAKLYRAVPKGPAPKVLYTAMHGVGLPWVRRSFAEFELPAFEVEPSQCDADANFPTVSFPNPEEKGALDKAMATGAQLGTDLIIANDPDADRLAVAERDGDGWRVFSGNEIGTLLASWMLEGSKEGSETPMSKVALLASTVSSKMLRAVAEAEGCLFEETLTGFKWLGRRANELRCQGYDVVFAFEEAIGFACGDLISDKDGVSAAAVFAEMGTAQYNAGSTVQQHLQALSTKYGEFVCHNGYFFCHDPQVAKSIVGSWSSAPGKYLETIAGYSVTAVRDLGPGAYDSTTPDKRPTLPTSASCPMVTFTFENGTVATFRTSGTEPKFKFYIEMAGKPGVARSAVQAELDKMVPLLLEELIQPDKNGLSRP